MQSLAQLEAASSAAAAASDARPAAHLGGPDHGPRRVPHQRAGLLQTYEHVRAQVLHPLELADGTPELLADLGVLGGRLKGAGRGAAGLGGEQQGGEVVDERGVDVQDAGAGDHGVLGAHLGGGAGGVGAVVGADAQGLGVHREPQRAVVGLGRQDHQLRLARGQYGRRGAVEQPAALALDGAERPGAQGHGPGPPPRGEVRHEVAVPTGTAQQLGGEHTREVGAGQRRAPGLLQDDGEFGQSAPAELRAEVDPEQPLLGEPVPVPRSRPGRLGRVEQLAHLRDRHGPRQPPPHRLGEFPLFLRDRDAHVRPHPSPDPERRKSRTRFNLTEGQIAMTFRNPAAPTQYGLRAARPDRPRRRTAPWTATHTYDPKEPGRGHCPASDPGRLRGGQGLHARTGRPGAVRGGRRGRGARAAAPGGRHLLRALHHPARRGRPRERHGRRHRRPPPRQRGAAARLGVPRPDGRRPARWGRWTRCPPSGGPCTRPVWRTT